MSSVGLDNLDQSRASNVESIRVRRVTEQTEWSAALETMPNHSILQTWQWGEFKALHGWQPHRIIGSAGESAICAAQILQRTIGPFSVLYVPRGPAGDLAAPVTVHALSLAIDELATETRAAIAFLEPVVPTAAVASVEGWTSTNVELQPLRTIKVDVDKDDDALLAQMKTKTRYNVRLAGRRGVTTRLGNSEDLIDFYMLLEETSERDEFGIHTVDYYADMLDAFPGQCALLLAEFEGELAAGAIILKSGDEAIYMFGASTKKHQRHMPTHLLQYEAMRWARDHGCLRYDLWGIPSTDTPPEEAETGELNVRSGLWGVYRFKQGFGGEIVSYPGVYERVYYPRLVNLWRRLRPGLGS